MKRSWGQQRGQSSTKTSVWRPETLEHAINHCGTPMEGSECCFVRHTGDSTASQATHELTHQLLQSTSRQSVTYKIWLITNHRSLFRIRSNSYQFCSTPPRVTIVWPYAATHIVDYFRQEWVVHLRQTVATTRARIPVWNGHWCCGWIKTREKPFGKRNPLVITWADTVVENNCSCTQAKKKRKKRVGIGLSRSRQDARTCCAQDIVSKRSVVVRAPSSANGGPGGRRWGRTPSKGGCKSQKTGLGRIPRHSSLRATCFKRNKERGGGEEEQTDKVWIKVWNINACDVRLLFPGS